MQFEEEIGAPIDFKRNGWLSLATQETAQDLRRNAELLQALDVRTEVLEPKEIKRRYPDIGSLGINRFGKRGHLEDS
jgi:glycine/D-amino acid oxidase-like deaminating enzyme